MLFMILKTVCDESGSEQWSVMRRDGKTIEDGIVSYNFSYSNPEAAIACRMKLEAKYS